MDAIHGLLNDAFYFLKADIAAIYDFERAARCVATINNREDKRAKHRIVIICERTIYENGLGVGGFQPVLALRGFCDRADCTAMRISRLEKLPPDGGTESFLPSLKVTVLPIPLALGGGFLWVGFLLINPT